jgi:hypothetical protein
MTPPASAAAQTEPKRRPATAARATARTASKRPGASSRAAARTASARAVPAPRPGQLGARRLSAPAPAQRRISGPSRGIARVAVASAAPAGAALVRRVSLQRLTYTRAWIGVVAFALIGIVTMQLLLLKLNTGIGQTLERTSALQRENAVLSVQASEAGAPQAIEAKARSAGMLTVAPGELHPLKAGGEGVARRAAAALRSNAAAGSSTAKSETSATTEVAESEGAVEEAPLEEAAPEGYEAEEAPVEEAPAGEALEGEAVEGEGAYVPSEAEAEADAEATAEAEAGYSPEAAPAGGVEAGAGG